MFPPRHLRDGHTNLRERTPDLRQTGRNRAKPVFRPFPSSCIDNRIGRLTRFLFFKRTKASVGGRRRTKAEFVHISIIVAATTKPSILLPVFAPPFIKHIKVPHGRSFCIPLRNPTSLVAGNSRPNHSTLDPTNQKFRSRASRSMNLLSCDTAIGLTTLSGQLW
jgi:hypothetical protein